MFDFNKPVSDIFNDHLISEKRIAEPSMDEFRLSHQDIPRLEIAEAAPSSAGVDQIVDAMNDNADRQIQELQRISEAAEKRAATAERAAEEAKIAAKSADKRANWSLAVAIASVIATIVIGLLQLKC